MKKIVKTLFGVLAIGLFGCSYTKYYTIKETQLNGIDWDKNTINYLPLSEKMLLGSVILDSAYSLIYQEKYNKLNKYLNSVESESQDYFLARTLYHIAKGDYVVANHYFLSVDKSDEFITKELLAIDLSYELARIRKERNYKMYLKDYQNLIDNYPDNENLRRIVALRIRYIRYNL